MVPDQDYYADKDGKLTTDPTKYARQIGVKGHFLDERTARRYGISDTLVSTDEPNASRRVTGRNESSVKISKTDERQEESEGPQEPAVAAETEAEEQEAEKPKAEPAKPAAKKGEKHQ